MEGGSEPRTYPCNRTMIHQQFHESCIPVKGHQFSINPRYSHNLEHSSGKQVPGLEPCLFNMGPQSTSSIFCSIIHPASELQVSVSYHPHT